MSGAGHPRYDGAHFPKTYTYPVWIQFKSENVDNDAVTDAVAANAYVEQFGLEVLGRAEATMKANKVTKWVVFVN